MKILALDTSTEYCSLAVWQDSDVLERELLAGQQHSDRILPLLRELLAEAGLSLTQLDGIGFGSCPGSFTGLRIACGVVQGMAFAAGLPVAGICTLEALAQQTESGRVVTAIDARMNQIYHAAYTRDKPADDWQVISEPVLCWPQDAPVIPAQDLVVCGSGFDRYEAVLGERYHGHIIRMIRNRYPRAREIAQLTASCLAKGLGTDPADATPLYIRNKVALTERERQENDAS